MENTGFRNVGSRSHLELFQLVLFCLQKHFNIVPALLAWRALCRTFQIIFEKLMILDILRDICNSEDYTIISLLHITLYMEKGIPIYACQAWISAEKFIKHTGR